jgi:hypothetical protein
MYYSIFDPYDEKYDIFLRQLNVKKDFSEKVFDNEDLCCIICLEIDTSFNKIKNMQSISSINLFCNCNVYIHEYCLDSWIKKTKTCPICLTKITQIDSIFTSDTIRNIVIVFFNDIVFKLIRYIMTINVILWTSYNLLIIYKIMARIEKNEFSEIEE